MLKSSRPSTYRHISKLTSPHEHPPHFHRPTQHTDADSALAQVQVLYQTSLEHLRQAMRDFVASTHFDQRVRAFYPFVRIHTKTGALQASTDRGSLS